MNHMDHPRKSIAMSMAWTILGAMAIADVSFGADAAVPTLPATAPATVSVDFATHIKPVFAKHCVSCHGPIKQRAGIRLDTGAQTLRGGKGGAIVVPHKPADSALIKAVLGQDDLEKMPKDADPLSSAEIALLTAWIEQGARIPKDESPAAAIDPLKHWSFQPPVKTPLPTVKNAAWSHHPIDAFLAAEHEKRGLTPVGPAPRHVLLRRVYLDLTGLPPTPAEIAAFEKAWEEWEKTRGIKGPSDQATEGSDPKPETRNPTLADSAGSAPYTLNPTPYTLLVDRLLASPRYGERWGRHWMDVWRYSDWYGYGNELRNSQKHIWRWRDWIIESLNSDKPYDRMIVQMLAADEAAPDDPNALRATGFLARNYYKFNRNVWLDSIVEHTGKAFLGLTTNCARCHEHKYDPIEHEEYYALRAFFEPHQLRLDRVPGQPNTDADGLARVFDADANVQTFLFERGNEKRPVKDKPIAPGIPQALAKAGPELSIQPVHLPVAAYYPAMQPFVQQEFVAAAKKSIADAKAGLNKAQAALEEARKKLAEFDAKEQEKEKVKDKPAIEAPAGKNAGAPASMPGESAAAPVSKAGDGAPAPTPGGASNAAKPVVVTTREALAFTVESSEKAVDVARLQVAAAEAERVSVEARIAADIARYAQPPAADAAARISAAASAARHQQFAAAQVALADAQKKIADAQFAAKSGDAKQAKTAEDLTKNLPNLIKNRDNAKVVLDKTDGDYAPLMPMQVKTSTGRRLALANWIASKKNPLTARVAVNHIWMRHFGQPLVPTVFDFGLNGKPPTHPALLDYLAVELMENNWSMKNLHRLIVTSQAYQMESGVGLGPRAKGQGEERKGTEGPRDQATKGSDPTPYTLNPKPFLSDPDNLHLWHMNSRRLEAEAVRDSLIHIAGKLDLTAGGPDLDHGTGLNTYRRSVYYRHALEKQMTFLAIFDAASPVEGYRRATTVVPQQALALANSSLALDMAKAVAAELTGNLGAATAETSAAFIRAAYLRVLCREPSAEETALCVEFLAEEKQPQRGRENLVHVLINHHEFVTIR